MSLSIKKHDIAGYAIIIYILAYMLAPSSGHISVQISRVLLVGIMVLYFIRKNEVNISAWKYILWAIVLLAWMCFCAFKAYSRSQAFDYVLTVAYVLICNSLIALYVPDHKYFIETILITLIYGAIFKALLVYIPEGFLVFLNSRGTEGVSANTIGYYSAFGAAIALYFALNKRRRVYYLLFAINLIFMILSASRKAFLFLGIPLAVMLILSSKNSAKIIRNIIIVILMGLIALLLLFNVDFLYELVGNRLETMINGFLGVGEVDASTLTRLSLIEYGIEWFKDSIWYGYGGGNFVLFSAAMGINSGEGYYAHNNYVEMLVDFGVIGFIIFYLLHFVLIVAFFKQYQKGLNLNSLMFGLLIAILVCDYGMVTYYDGYTHLLLLVGTLVFMSTGSIKFKSTKMVNVNVHKRIAQKSLWNF